MRMIGGEVVILSDKNSNWCLIDNFGSSVRNETPLVGSAPSFVSSFFVCTSDSSEVGQWKEWCLSFKSPLPHKSMVSLAFILVYWPPVAIHIFSRPFFFQSSIILAKSQLPHFFWGGGYCDDWSISDIFVYGSISSRLFPQSVVPGHFTSASDILPPSSVLQF